MPEGLSIAQMLDILQPDNSLKRYGHVFIGDMYIPKENWHLVRPKSGATISLKLYMGKGGGGKNPLKTILSIAVMIAAPYVGAALAGAVGFAGVTIGGTLFSGATIFSGVFSVVGNLIINAIAPPPTPKLNRLSTGGTSTEDSPTLFISGARNQLLQFGIIPVVLGTHKMVPPLAARTFTEVAGDDQYVRQLFCWGYGEEIEIESEKIGETLLSEFEGVETENILDGDSTQTINLYSNSIFQEDLNIALTAASSWQARTSQTTTNELVIDLTFPRGLAAFNDQGSRGSMTVSGEYRYKKTSSGTWTTGSFSYTLAKTSAVRREIRISGLDTDQYNVEVRRTTADTDSSQIFDELFWTALRSVEYVQPVLFDGLCLTAMRIKGTDQLNGAVDQYNAIVSNKILDYNNALSPPDWVRRKTSNCASIFRYVLQGAPNERPLDDSRLNLEQIEYWHDFCRENDYTYNAVIDYETTVRNILLDVCAAGRASPTIIDGKWSVVIDEEKMNVVQHFSPKNTWDYQGEKIFPIVPHAFRVQFVNSEADYQQDEIIVYDDGYDSATATKFERLELVGVTNYQQAWKQARQHLAVIRLRPEIHSFSVDVEHLVATRGDLVRFQHDVPLVGVSSGRVLSVASSGSPALANSVTVDEACPMEAGKFYSVRFRLSDGNTVLKQVNTIVGSNNKTLTFTTPFTIDDAPEEGDMFFFGETTKETMELVIQRIEPGPDESAKLYCVNHSPQIFDAHLGTIPPFDTNITVPLEFKKPVPPTIVSIQTGEEVMIRNIDGSITSRMVITLNNENLGTVVPVVEIRQASETNYSRAEVVSSDSQRIVLEGLDDGTRYDVRIKYRREGSILQQYNGLFSDWVFRNNVLFEGQSGLPDNVTNVRLAVTGQLAILSWDPVKNIDFDHYTIRFSPELSGVTWGGAQILNSFVQETRYPTPLQIGTYLVKAVDRKGNESEDAGLVSTNISELAGLNVVEELIEDPLFGGTFDNTLVDDSSLKLDDLSLLAGTYVFENIIDLTEVYTSRVTPNIVARGEAQANVLDSWDSLDSVDSLSGADPSSWSVRLQISITEDNPSGSPVSWSAWEDVVVGDYSFRAARFRVILTTNTTLSTPVVSRLRVTIDMPDRIYAENDVVVPTSGLSVLYQPPFKAKPKLVITAQDLQTGDYWELTSQTRSGFDVIFKNSGGTAVERTMDFIATGYGRDLS